MKAKYLSILLVWAATGVNANAQVIALHENSADPVTEGWTLRVGNPFAPPVSLYPVFDDLGLGVDAWAIDDNSATEAGYRVQLTPQEIEDAIRFGWKLSARVRVVDVPFAEPHNQFTVAQILVGHGPSSYFGMAFSMKCDGSPLVNVGSEASLEIIDLDDLGGGYHVYELEFDPITNQAELFVDHTLRASGIEAFVDDAPGASGIAVSQGNGTDWSESSVNFGSSFSRGSGHANYNLVKYEILPAIPEPSTLLLLGAATCLLWGLRRCSRQTHQPKVAWVLGILPRRWEIRALLVVILCAVLPNQSFGTNVARGKPVTLSRVFGSDPALAPTVTDGVFLPKNTQWRNGTVWWDADSSRGNSVIVDLEGNFEINALVVQVDDNDAYVLDFLTPSGDWVRAWNVPNYDFEPYGMQTRPNPNDNAERFVLPSPITATKLRLSGNDADSDLLYSVSEIQAFLVPEPSMLLLCGLCCVAAVVFPKCFRVARTRRPFAIETDLECRLPHLPPAVAF